MHAPPPPTDGAAPDETRAIARLPGLDIAILHTRAQAGQGERLAVVMQRTAPLPPLALPDPVSLWLQMAQAAWAPWLALTGALWGAPRITNRK